MMIIFDAKLDKFYGMDGSNHAKKCKSPAERLGSAVGAKEEADEDVSFDNEKKGEPTDEDFSFDGLDDDTDTDTNEKPDTQSTPDPADTTGDPDDDFDDGFDFDDE